KKNAITLKSIQNHLGLNMISMRSGVQSELLWKPFSKELKFLRMISWPLVSLISERRPALSTKKEGHSITQLYGKIEEPLHIVKKMLPNTRKSVVKKQVFH